MTPTGASNPQSHVNAQGPAISGYSENARTWIQVEQETPLRYESFFMYGESDSEDTLLHVKDYPWGTLGGGAYGGGSDYAAANGTQCGPIKLAVDFPLDDGDWTVTVERIQL